jgi:hypothetical protein
LVAVAVAVGVDVAVGVNVAIGVGEGVGVAHGMKSCTSSTYMAVRLPTPSWCTRNLTLTVIPAYGAISTVWLIHVSVSLH